MDTSNFLQQMAGSIDKAILFIRKDKSNASNENNNVGNNINTIPSMADLREQAMGGTGQNAQENLKKSKNSMKKTYYDSLLNNYHAFFVQYNPSSIRFNSVAGTNSMARGAGEGGNKLIIDQDYPPQTIMDVELIFQDVNPIDAFGKNGFEKVMNMKNNLSVSGIYQTAKAIKSKYSVQDQVEALLAILMDVDTSKVIFHWSDLDFEGVVNRIDVTYTMFSNAGRPIAAKVGMTLKNTDESEVDDNYDVEHDNANDKYWNDAFDRMFNNDTLAGKREDGGWYDSIGNW